MTHTRILVASMALVLLIVGFVSVLNQPLKATISFEEICKAKPWLCRGLTYPWWFSLEPGCRYCLPTFDIRDIITLPDNQSFSISVEHGLNSDTIKMDIPKALSAKILNESAVGFNPQPQPSGMQAN